MKLFLKTIAVVMLSLTALHAKAENLALILSFENYENGRDIRNALRTHDALLAAYRAAGYQTFAGRDRSHAQLRRLLGNFVEELADADTAIIHINGHVASFGNESWVLPSDTTAQTVAGLEIDGISVGFLLELLANKPGNSVLFLGLPSRGFDTIPGMRPGVSNANIPDGVMMVSGEMADVSRAVMRDFMAPETIVIEALANNRRRLTVDGDIPFDLVLAGENQPPRVTTAEQIEAALGLSRNQKRSIQTDLTILGYGLGTVDGVFGNATRHAVQRWQQNQRLSATGYLTLDQVRRMNDMGELARREIEAEDRAYWARTGANGLANSLLAYLNRYPDGLFAERAREELSEQEQVFDVDEWDRAVDTNTLLSYQRYLEQYPSGIYNRLAKVRVQEFMANVPQPNTDAQRAENRLRLDQSSRLLIELRLAGLGYPIGRADGDFNDDTRAGIRRYQEDRAVQVTGYISADLIRQLLLGR